MTCMLVFLHQLAFRNIEVKEISGAGDCGSVRNLSLSSKESHLDRQAPTTQ